MSYILFGYYFKLISLKYIFVASWEEIKNLITSKNWI